MEQCSQIAGRIDCEERGKRPHIICYKYAYITPLQTAITSLSGAMMQLYPEQLPPDIQRRARAIAFAFQKERFATKRELNLLSQVTAEVSKIFPPDFASALPDAIESRVRVRSVRIYMLTENVYALQARHVFQRNK